MKDGINYLDLFSGIGGFALGLQKAGVKINNHFFSEIEPHAIRLYEKQFPKAKGLGDVTTIESFSEIGDIDLITFGFPCQDLSTAGKGKGFDGTRSVLFYAATQIIRQTRPTYFVFENVKGLLTNDNGRTFEKVLQEIADIGIYDCEWQLVNTKWFLPQNRERIYFIGHLRGGSCPKVFPITEDSVKNLGLQRQYSNTITTRYKDSVGTYVAESKFVQKTKRNSQGYRVNSTSKHSVCLTSASGGMGAKTGLYAVRAVLTPDRVNKRQNGRRFKEVGEPAFTLTTQDQHGVILGNPNDTQGFAIRKLTPLECERLQGFPDNWTDGFSDNQRYKMLGNAVSVPIPEYIFNRLYNEQD